MRTNVVSLIPQIELDIIEAYLFDKGEYEFEEYLDEAEVPEPSETSRLSVAVAQILLNRIQGTLPQTGWIDANNDARASRQEIKRHKDATKLSDEKIRSLNASIKKLLMKKDTSVEIIVMKEIE